MGVGLKVVRCIRGCDFCLICVTLIGNEALVLSIQLLCADIQQKLELGKELIDEAWVSVCHSIRFVEALPSQLPFEDFVHGQNYMAVGWHRS